MRSTCAVSVLLAALAGCGPQLAPDEADGVSTTESAIKVRAPGPATYWVRARSSISDSVCTGNGSKGRPFCTIGQAIAAADAAAATSLSLNLYDGTFVEDVQITRATTISGQSREGVVLFGTIESWVATTLKVHRLTITGGTRNGGLFVASPCERPFSLIQQPYQACASNASTTVDEVTLHGLKHWGIRQSGGSLSISNTLVMGTWADAPEPTGLQNGAGLHVLGQANATVHHTLFDGNAQGILVQDAGLSITEAVEVRNSTNRVPGRPVAPAVEVSNGGYLVSQASAAAIAATPDGHYSAALRVSNNRKIGIAVNSGASAVLRNFTVADTVADTLADPLVSELLDANVLGDGNSLQVDTFRVRGAAVGLLWASGDMWASHGRVEEHDIGAVIVPTDVDFGQLFQNVAYVNNGIIAQAMVMPLPPPPVLP